MPHKLRLGRDFSCHRLFKIATITTLKPWWIANLSEQLTVGNVFTVSDFLRPGLGPVRDAWNIAESPSQRICSYPGRSNRLAGSPACRRSRGGWCCRAGRCAAGRGTAGRCSGLLASPPVCRCQVDMLVGARRGETLRLRANSWTVNVCNGTQEETKKRQLDGKIGWWTEKTKLSALWPNLKNCLTDSREDFDHTRVWTCGGGKCSKKMTVISLAARWKMQVQRGFLN